MNRRTKTRPLAAARAAKLAAAAPTCGLPECPGPARWEMHSTSNKKHWHTSRDYRLLLCDRHANLHLESPLLAPYEP